MACTPDWDISFYSGYAAVFLVHLVVTGLWHMCGAEAGPKSLSFVWAWLPLALFFCSGLVDFDAMQTPPPLHIARNLTTAETSGIAMSLKLTQASAAGWETAASLARVGPPSQLWSRLLQSFVLFRHWQPAQVLYLVSFGLALSAGHAAILLFARMCLLLFSSPCSMNPTSHHQLRGRRRRGWFVYLNFARVASDASLAFAPAALAAVLVILYQTLCHLVLVACRGLLRGTAGVAGSARALHSQVLRAHVAARQASRVSHRRNSLLYDDEGGDALPEANLLRFDSDGANGNLNADKWSYRDAYYDPEAGLHDASSPSQSNAAAAIKYIPSPSIRMAGAKSNNLTSESGVMSSTLPEDVFI